jgi:hypothetical protein
MTHEANTTIPGNGSGWPTPIPEDCPLPRSTALSGLRFTGRHFNYARGEYWTTSWAADGHLYVSCGDAPGIWNAGLYRIEGDHPGALSYCFLKIGLTPSDQRVEETHRKGDRP